MRRVCDVSCFIFVLLSGVDKCFIKKDTAVIRTSPRVGSSNLPRSLNVKVCISISVTLITNSNVTSEALIMRQVGVESRGVLGMQL